MSLITYIAFGTLLVGAVCLLLGLSLDESNSWGEFFGITGLGILIVSLITFLIWGGSSLVYRMSANECEKFGEQAQVDTKMARYNSTDWDCLVKSDSGWVVKENYWNSEESNS